MSDHGDPGEMPEGEDEQSESERARRERRERPQGRRREPRYDPVTGQELPDRRRDDGEAD